MMLADRIPISKTYKTKVIRSSGNSRLKRKDWLESPRSKMPSNFFDRTPEQQNVLIDSATLQNAQRMIGGCEACSEHAELPFENILDRLTGSDPSITDYVLKGAPPLPKRPLVNWGDDA
jgi:hypothetical protein